MPHWMTALYVDAIPELEASEVLTSLMVSDFPHYDVGSRNRIQRGLERELGATLEPTIDPSSPLGQATLADMGIGVKVTKVE